MNRYFLAFLVGAVLSGSAGPGAARADTLFPGYIETTGYLSANLRLTHIGDHETGTFLGGGAGVLLDRRVMIGGDLSFLADDLPYVTADGEDRFIEYTSLYLRMGYIFFPEVIVHPVFTVDTGMGWIRLRNPDRAVDELDPDSDTIFQVQPVLHLMVNLTRNARLSVGGGFRWVSGVDTGEFRDADAEGMFGELMVSFGGF